jgi:carbon storage regulator
MLVLTRKVAQKVYIGTDICVTVVKLDGGQVRLGIEAPREIPVMRAELISVLTNHAKRPPVAPGQMESLSGPSEPLLGPPAVAEHAVLEFSGSPRAVARPEPSPMAGRAHEVRPLPRLVHGIGIRRRAPSR